MCYVEGFSQLVLILQRMAGATLIVFANKQDLSSAASASEIAEVSRDLAPVLLYLSLSELEVLIVFRIYGINKPYLDDCSYRF